ncbi:hypothetical protein HK097_003583, partial [Rhizophlyctis rosea]
MGSLLSRKAADKNDEESTTKSRSAGNLSINSLNLNRSMGKLSSVAPPDTLEQILTGKTCTPMSLAEFREFLATKEFSEENLDAYEWYQAYRTRFFSLPDSTQ